MLYAAVIEDNKIQSRLISGYVNEWAKNSGVRIKIGLFPSAENFWFEFEVHPEVNIILLDIQMEKINGIELAKKIRQKGGGQIIIFITGIPDYMQEGYDVEAFHYLLKPVKKEKLFECLDRALKRQNISNGFIVVLCNKDKFKIFQDEIIFAESVGHNLKIKTLKSEFSTRMLLSESENILNKDFFVKTHRAFLVNIKHIKQVRKKTLLMADGSEIPISRREYKNVNNRFIQYYTRGTQ